MAPRGAAPDTLQLVNLAEYAKKQATQYVVNAEFNRATLHFSDQPSAIEHTSAVIDGRAMADAGHMIFT